MSPWLIGFMGPHIASDGARHDVYNVRVSAQENSLIKHMLKRIVELITVYDGVFDNFHQNVNRVNGRKMLSVMSAN